MQVLRIFNAISQVKHIGQTSCSENQNKTSSSTYYYSIFKPLFASLFGLTLITLSGNAHSDVTLEAKDVDINFGQVKIKINPALAEGDKLEFIIDGNIAMETTVQGVSGVQEIKTQMKYWGEQNPPGSGTVKTHEAKALVTRKDGKIESQTKQVRMLTHINYFISDYLKNKEKWISEDMSNKVKSKARRNQIRIQLGNPMLLWNYVDTLDIVTDTTNIKTKLTPYNTNMLTFITTENNKKKSSKITATLSDSEYKFSK